MTVLTEEQIVGIAAAAATMNNLPIHSISTTSTIDCEGEPTIIIRIMVPSGSSASIIGLPSANTTSQIVRDLADKDDERSPIICFDEEQHAAHV